MVLPEMDPRLDAAPTVSAPPPPVRLTPPNPWIESREGALVFTNALFVFPYLLVLIPLLTRVIARGLMGRFPEPSIVVDTFPALADHFIPTVGWLALVPLLLTAKNLPHVVMPWARTLLWVCIGLHGAVVLWTVLGWLGVHGGVLPGAIPVG
jgi:hypothetical protein